MAGLPAIRSSNFARMASTGAVARVRGGPDAAAGATATPAVERTDVLRVVEPAAPPIPGRPREAAAAVLLAQARDATADAASLASAPVECGRASLAYRRHGALPEYYDERPVVFRVRI
jgi:hypothetical protein